MPALPNCSDLTDTREMLPLFITRSFPFRIYTLVFIVISIAATKFVIVVFDDGVVVDIRCT